MIFESLMDKLQSTFKNLSKKGKLDEKDIKTAMREVKLALLEADVNFKVVKEFTKNVSERALGAKVLEGLNPSHQVIKIVSEELTALMGTAETKINFSSKPPTVIMMVGLQGCGKTTTSGKLGAILKKQGKNPLLVACDVYRPAAVKQLEVVAKQLNLEIFKKEDSKDVVQIATDAIEFSRENLNDVVIIDTAGRLHIDENLMDELENIKSNVNPDEILLVIDAMTGQDAVNVAESFNAHLSIDGIIITKLDGDTRGGAALSVRSVTNKPIKFVGMGEKLSDLEVFHPSRMSSRILGMGDIESLIEKAQSAFDEKQMLEIEKKMRSQQFTLDDYLVQMQQIKNMGPMEQILGMIPGFNSKMLKEANLDPKKMSHIEAIIKSMTKEERLNPSIINSGRKKRVADGSGTTVQEVNLLLKQFEEIQKLMKAFSNPKKFKKFKLPF